MCTLYYFYFLFSRVAQMTPYFMISSVLKFIVNQNFKLLNRYIILLLLSFVLLPFAFCIFLCSCCLRYYCPIIIVIYLLLLFTHLFTYLFIHIILSIYLFCVLDLYPVQPFRSSPRIRFTTVYIAYL